MNSSAYLGRPEENSDKQIERNLEINYNRQTILKIINKYSQWQFIHYLFPNL
jgi:hypothetical protein